MSRAEHLQQSINRLVDLLEEQGPVAIARPRPAGGWSLHLHDQDSETTVDLPDWEQMHLSLVGSILHTQGYSVPSDALMATDRHAGWAHHEAPGRAWTAPIFRN